MSVAVHEQLTVDDLFRAADLIAAVLDRLDASTLERIQAGTADRHELGRQVVTVALRVAPEAGKRFMAGLVDRTPEEFGALPMEATLDVIEQLKARDDLAGFFKRARALAASITGEDEAEAKVPKGVAEPAR